MKLIVKARFAKLAVVVAVTLAIAGMVSAPSANGEVSSGPSLTLPDLGYYGPTGQQIWPGYERLSTTVETSPDPATGASVESIELVAGGSDETVPAPSGGTGTVTFSLPTTFPYRVDGYLVAIDADGATSDQMPVMIVPQQYSAHLDYDTGATHDGVPQLEGDDAHITVTPQWYDGSDQTTSWVTDVAVQFDLRPVGEVSGLQTNGPVSLDLQNADGSAFNPGSHELSVAVTDNHGNQQWSNLEVWVVNPVTATWSIGTTDPDVPTTVAATIHNDTDVAISSLALRTRDGTVVATVSNPAEASPTISSTMTFDPGGNYPNVIVTLANGTSYEVFQEVLSLIPVQSSLQAPDHPAWNDDATFHARAVSPQGAAQSRLLLDLQSRAPGSAEWVSRAKAVTDKHGNAVMTVPAATTGSASWRVVSSRTPKRKASRSHVRTVRVHAAFGRLPGARSVHESRTVHYELAVHPATSGMHLAVQCRRAGSSHWSKLDDVPVAQGPTAIAVRLAKAGRYRVRVVVAASSHITTTASPSWVLHVVK